MDPHASREEDALRDWEHLFSSYAEVRQGIRVEVLPRYRTTSAASRRSIEALVWSDLRKRLSKVLSRSNRAMRDGIQLSEALTGDGARIFRHACSMGLEGIVSKRIGSRYVSGRTRAWLKTKKPGFRAAIGRARDTSGDEPKAWVAYGPSPRPFEGPTAWMG